MAAKKQEIVPTETKFNLKLGDKIYTLNFGTATFRRIKFENPSITSAFEVLTEMNPVELLPCLIHAAIKPEERGWTNEDDFLDLYDECTDAAMSKVIPGYISAMGVAEKKLTPALAAVQKMEGESKK